MPDAASSLWLQSVTLSTLERAAAAVGKKLRVELA